MEESAGQATPEAEGVTVHAFGAACHYHGKKIQNVIAELMREYAEKVLGKG
jgi:hypothetical protein